MLDERGALAAVAKRQAATAEAATRICEVGVDQLAVPVKISVGIATTIPGSTPGNLLKQADAAMYLANADGRDRIVTSA